MKIKMQIKNRWTGSIIFDYEKEDNTIKQALVEAVKRGADLQGLKIKTAIVFTGLYDYIVIPYIT